MRIRTTIYKETMSHAKLQRGRHKTAVSPLLQRPKKKGGRRRGKY